MFLGGRRAVDQKDLMELDPSNRRFRREPRECFSDGAGVKCPGVGAELVVVAGADVSGVYEVAEY